MRTLVTGTIPGIPDEVVAAIARRADGVPLYAVEMARMLLADGTVESTEAGYRLTRPVAEVPIPETLHALIGARVDALAPGDRELLQHGSVLGLSFTVAAISSVSGRTAAELEIPLERIARGQLLRLEADPESPERGQYQFFQAVVRDVVYATLSKRDRRDRHLAAARYFESIEDDELAAVLAFHYDAAREAAPAGDEAAALTAQARVAYRAAAERAARLFSYEAAIRFLERAMALSSDDRECAALAERAGDLAYLADATSTAEELYGRAIAYHRGVGDAGSELSVLAKLATALSTQGRPREAITLLDEAARRLSEAIEEGGAGVVGFLGQLGRACYLARDLGPAVTRIDQAIAVAERRDEHEVLVDALITKGLIASETRPREGWALLAGARELARGFGLPQPWSRAIHNLLVVVPNEDPHAARELAREGSDLARRMGDWGSLAAHAAGIAYQRFELMDWDGVFAELAPFDRAALGPWTQLQLRWQELLVVAFRGDLDTFAAWEAEASAYAATIDNPEYLAGHATNRSWQMIGLGRFDEAAALMAPVVGQPGTGWGQLVTQAIAAALVGDERGAALALDDFEASGARGRVVAVQRLNLRAIAAGLRQDPQAGALFEQAISGYEALDLPFWSAFVRAMMVLLLPRDRADVIAAERRMREQFAVVGATGFLAVIDRELEARPVSRERTSVRHGARSLEPTG